MLLPARSGTISIGITANIDIDRGFKKWEHDFYHRRGVQYDNYAVRNKFAKADTQPVDRKLDYRGRSGDQVLKPGKAEGKSGGAELPTRAAIGRILALRDRCGGPRTVVNNRGWFSKDWQSMPLTRETVGK